MMRKTFCLAVLAASLLLIQTPSTLAKDYCLTLGGGYSPQGNQVSLEKNVLFFQRLLAEHAPQGIPHDVYFSDGGSPDRDLQYDDHSVPAATKLLARLFTSEKYLGLRYRSAEIPGLNGASNRENIERWFAEVGSKLAAGDRLILYVTAHGGKSRDKKNAFNTKLYLWNGESIEASDLEAQLDKLPEQVSVVMVMVQCYSGGFAHTIFNEADDDKGLSEHDRCGFFATVNTRPAAGCTPDINEENYQEYSSFFWAAIRGKTRTEQPIEAPDYDGDGKVSFAEAHAYSLLTSNSIDISVKTSGAFLRKFSKTSDKGRDDLIAADAPYSRIAELASPVDRAVLDGLSTQLELTGEDRAKQAKQLGEKLQKDRKSREDARKSKKGEYDKLRKVLQNHARARWPEIANVLNPEVSALIANRPNEFIDQVQSHPKFSDWQRLYNELQAIDDERLDMDRRWAKCQRYLRTAENVALAANLPKVADQQAQVRFERLLNLEAGALEE